MMDVDSDILLDLRRGDREGFVRYFELYRAPVYDLIRWLLHDDEGAVSATDDAFTTAYRRILLADGRIDLRAWTFKAAYGVCYERLGGAGAHRGPTPSAAAGTARREPSELVRRFVQALGMVEFHHQAVLLLHDISELRPAELATVFGVTEDAEGVLLFRAREAFRRAFEEVSSDRRLAACRLAEQMAAGAVGGSLSTIELDRLDEHATYCRDCRRTMKVWRRGALGLALCLGSAPLPKGLEAAPVFGTPVPITGAADSGALAGALGGVLARIGRAAASRAAAYTLAAVCLAFALGLVVEHPWSDRSVIVLSATPLGGPRLARPAPAAAASTAAIFSSASSSQAAIESLARVVSYAGVSEPVAMAATNVARLARGRLIVGGSTSVSADLAAGVAPNGNARGHSKGSKAAHGAAHPGHSHRGHRGHAQPAATQHGQKQKPKHVGGGAKKGTVKAKNQHAQKDQNHQKKTKNK